MKKGEPLVDVIICTYNNKDIIKKCLDSVINSSFKNHKITLVINNSTDGTEKYVKKNYPLINIIVNKENLGPAKGRNIGIKKTNGEYIITLDADAVLTKDWLKKMTDFMNKNKNIGIGCGKLLLPDGRINSCGGNLRKVGIGGDIGFGEKNVGFNKEKEVIFACSAAMIIRREILNKSGFFDDEYFYGFEDVDLCWRVNLIGKKVKYFPNAIAYHNMNTDVKKIFRKSIFYRTKDTIRTLLKNYELKNIIIYLPQFFVISIGGGILHRRFIKESIAAWIWNLIKIKETLKLRKEIQKSRVIKDNELFEIF